MPEPTVLAVAALSHEIGAPGTLRPHQTFGEAVVGRIAVDDNGRGAVLLSGVNFDRSMAARVTRDHDLALDVDAGRGHLVVIRWQPVVHIAHRRGHRS